MPQSLGDLDYGDFTAWSQVPGPVIFNDWQLVVKDSAEQETALNDNRAMNLSFGGSELPQNILAPQQVAVYLAIGGKQRSERAAET